MKSTPKGFSVFVAVGLLMNPLAEGRAESGFPIGWSLLKPEHQALAERLRTMRLDQGPEHVPAFCFTPGYPEKAIAAFEERIWGTQKYRPLNRWTRTATNSSIAAGQPFTLTYSFVPDGTPVSGIQTGPVPSRLFAFFEEDCGYTREEWQGFFHDTFSRFESLTGIRYVYQPTDDGAGFPDNGGSLTVRGDVRIAGASIDGESGGNTLGFNYYPNNGDMVLDTDNVQFFSNRTANSLGLRNTIAHEHGHGLGLAHVCPGNRTKLMEPSIATAFDGPQDDDIQGVQFSYDDALAGNQTPAAAAAIALSAGVGAVADLAVTPTRPDWFAITLPESGLLTISAVPIGGEYLEGPQNDNGSCSAGTLVDSRRALDLAVELRTSDGATLLARSEADAPGTAAIIDGAAIGAGGTYLLQVLGSGDSGVQRYALDVTFSEQAVPLADLATTIESAQASTTPGTLVSYDIVVSNAGPQAADGASILLQLPAFASIEGWSAVYTEGASGALTGTDSIIAVDNFPASASVQIELQSRLVAPLPRTALTATASAILPTSVADADLSNNAATLIIPVVSDAPTNVEEFNAFTGIFAGSDFSPSDVGPQFQRLGTAIVTEGFVVDTEISQNGRGLTFRGTETALMRHEVDLTPLVPFEERAHMLALWFRMEDPGAQGNNTWTQLLHATNRDGGLAYAIFIGRTPAPNPRLGLRLVAPSQTTNVYNIITPGGITIPAEQWNRLIVQYRAASDSTLAPTEAAELRVFINPANDSANPTATMGGSITSQFGNGPLGRYGFGRTFSSSVFGQDGPRVWVDSVGAWDGFGVAGANDLAAARKHLDGALDQPPTIAFTGETLSVRGGGESAEVLLAVLDDLEDGPENLTVQLGGDFAGLVTTISLYNGASGEFRFGVRATCEAIAGVRQLVLIVSDSRGNQTIGEFEVNVAANSAPTLGVYTDATVDRGNVVDLTPSAPPADLEGPLASVTVSPTTLSGGGSVAIDPATGVVTVTTTSTTTPGNLIIQVRAVDGCEVSSITEAQLFIGGPDVFPILSVVGDSGAITDGSIVDLGVADLGGSPLRLTLRVRNDGNVPLVLTDLAVPDDYLIITPLADDLAPEQESDLVIELPASTVGTFGGILSFSTNAEATPTFSITVTGRVRVPPVGERWILSLAR